MIETSERRQRLLRAVKKEVKQIMEEAVTRKFVHEESGSITSLCGAVEACLLDGLKKRSLGLFKESTTVALFQKTSKYCKAASQVAKKVMELESGSNENGSKRSMDTFRLYTKRYQSYNPRHLWLRQSIFEKQLTKILEYLVENSGRYYEVDSLVADPVDGPIFASLLVGPCALDYTKMKTSDHFWTDPPADELVQRHRIHSGGNHVFSNQTTPGSPKRPGLQIRRAKSGSEDSPKMLHVSAREYVESLHQNNKTTLLYGKNNVQVQPKEDVPSLAGYLSLHQCAERLMIMWTPNQLMNGGSDNVDDDSDRSIYWEYAMTVFLDEVVYIHCHQQPDCGGTVVLVGQDGVQRPPVHFPKGGHLLAFLSVLETALLPHNQLDPPLWNQRGKGKVASSSNSSTSSYSTDEEEATDYVFRIISSFRPENITAEMLDPKSSVQCYARAQEEQNTTCIYESNGHLHSHIKQLCDTMRKQIISRAFYGWLAHCRHLKTVRTHLSGLVNSAVVQADKPTDATGGLTEEKWQEFNIDGVVINKSEIYRLVYFGGIAHCLRKDVWPYLLGHYSFGSTVEERKIVDERCRSEYERIMSEWLAVEAIVSQRDKELMAANLAKFSQESTDGVIPLIRKDSSLSNDVFESFDSEEFSHPSTVPEESYNPTPTSDLKNNLDLIQPTDLEPVLHKQLDSLIDNSDVILEETEQQSIDFDEDLEKSCEVETIEKLNLNYNDPMVTNQSSASKESLISPASPASNGGIYSSELLDAVALNLHRIDKDVLRCDRNYYYFTPNNLDKLRNIMCTYVWQHLEIGYVQGMCDLVAPLLVIFDDESLTYSCFCELMKRLTCNFPHGGAMDTHFANMRSLIQILDAELFEHMHHYGDYTHFYFCYRWFLLDFKRELVYDDVFSVWETIWAAKHVSSANFVLFIALALVEYYRDIILDNKMDFTDIIKFFNEMAERHNASKVLSISRDLVLRLQTLIDNK
ncbi:hypothetical protein LOTGIDRAFT_132957 [Lottia gigantea]|uniref:Rab-GAP TBC domain-containing protein n=1 Tax=Lottia gigantea TaxID=225164 RepID=V3ZSC8_LOTGI|nr:hypothetical protein LOTGIDRAFT_132957 [Lottia gigantea]ESO83806.1 hypothetical protein LOTGIDRAFT_132957 [Lottia gigantea]